MTKQDLAKSVGSDSHLFHSRPQADPLPHRLRKSQETRAYFQTEEEEATDKPGEREASAATQRPDAQAEHPLRDRRGRSRACSSAPCFTRSKQTQGCSLQIMNLLLSSQFLKVRKTYCCLSANSDFSGQGTRLLPADGWLFVHAALPGTRTVQQAARPQRLPFSASHKFLSGHCWPAAPRPRRTHVSTCLHKALSPGLPRLRACPPCPLGGPAEKRTAGPQPQSDSRSG